MPKVIGIILGFTAFMIVALIGALQEENLEQVLTGAFYALCIFMAIGYVLGSIGVRVLTENFDDLTMNERENEITLLKDRLVREEKKVKAKEEQAIKAAQEQAELEAREAEERKAREDTAKSDAARKRKR